jgi:hypothetical protein
MLTLQSFETVKGRGARIFQKYRSHVNILGTKLVTWSKAHTENRQIWGITMRNWDARVTWSPGFLYLWFEEQSSL